MKKNENKMLSEKAAEFVRRQIISGEIPAGKRLVESEITELLDMSRGPVRDALKQLMHEGLVIYEPNKGCKVCELSMEDAYETFYLRGNLEMMALRQCGGTLSDRSILVMQNCLEEMKKFQEEKDLPGIRKMDDLFHAEIVHSCKMQRLIFMWESLKPLNGAMFLKVNDTFRLQEGENAQDIFGDYKRRTNYDSHAEILAALKKGDVDGAINRIEEHYVRVGEQIYKIESKRKIRACGEKETEASREGL